MKVLKVFTLVAAFCAAGIAAQVHAQVGSYPTKPLTLISGFAAGGSSDAVAREIAIALGDELGQQVVVENKAGAAGLIGLDALTKAAPDGYTLGFLANTTLNALHFANKPLDLSNRFIPIGRFTSTRLLLVVNPKVIDVKTLPELTEFLRRNPGTAMTSSGHGGLSHLGLELFAMEQGLKILHVPFRGAGPAMNEVLAGRIGGMVSEANFALPQLKDGKLRAISTVSSERTPVLPDLPTAIEQGYKSLEIDSTLGIVVPPGTPQPVVDRLRSALRKAVDGRSFTEAARNRWNARFFQDGPQYSAWMEADFKRWGEVIRAAKISDK